MKRQFTIYKLQFTNLERGFTFIELIVVFSIILILSTIGIASFVDYSRSQQVNSYAFDLVSTINLAKSRSTSQVKPDVCDQNTTLEGYEVSICGQGLISCTSGIPNGFELYAKCSGNMYLIPNYNKALPNSSLTFGPYPNVTTTTSIFFPILSGGTQGAGKIVIKGYGKTKTITINSSGSITVQ